MAIVDKDSAINYIQKLGNVSDREKLFSIYEEIPYQLIHDSPTIKHYTDWDLFDNLDLKIDYGSKKNLDSPLKDYKLISIVNNIIEGTEVFDSPKNSGIDPKEHKLVALNLALSKKIIIDRPGKYFIYHYADQELYSPINIEINVNDDISDIVYYSESFGKSMPSSTIYLKVGKDATVNFSTIVKGNSSYSFVYAKAEVDGSINSSIFASGSSQAHIEYKSILGSYSNASFNVKALGIKDNNIDIVSDVTHIGEKSVSTGSMKAVAANTSLTVIRGDAKVGETAHDSSTSIIGRAIMLGKQSKAIVAPMLEVKTGRVITAKHSAAVSRVNEDLVFYLQNRGFDRKTAEGLIIRGFLNDENDISIVKEMVEKIISDLGY